MSKKDNLFIFEILSILLISSFSFSVFGEDQKLSILENNNKVNSELFVPGQVLVGLEKPDPSFNDKATFHGGQIINSIEKINTFVVKVPINAEDQFISAISNNPNVSYAERDAIMTATYIPDDEFYDIQWGLSRIGMETAWEPNPSLGNGIIVAVVDTGMYPDHPDMLGTTILTNRDYDFVDNDNNTRPTRTCGNSAEYHGTFVGGVIAATKDNSIGVAGIGPFSILPVRVLNHCGSGFSSDVASGIIHAADEGANVINLSLGSSVPSNTIENAVNYAYDIPIDAVIVAASGNDGNSQISYPAGFANVTSTGAITNTGARASYSQYGNTLELSAPGGSSGTCSSSGTPYIVSTGVSKSGPTISFIYQCGTGTSFAAPHVSGVAGLVKAANPSATNEEIRLHLQQTAEDLGPLGYDEEFGYGLVRADTALSIPINGIVLNIPIITTPSFTTNFAPITITGTADADFIIELYHDASSLGTQTADSFGNWQFTNVVLNEGNNSFTATASDGINTSDLSAATVITLDTSPLVHYEFNDDLLDSTGNGNTGTINTSGSEKYIAGPYGKAFNLNGDSHIETNSPSFDFEKNEPFTLSTWFKTDITGATDVLLGKLTQGLGYQVYLKSNDEVVVHIGHASDNRILVETVGANVRDGEWHHLIMTYDGSELASGVTVYLDGVASPLNVINDTLDASIVGDKKFTIGNQQENGNFFFTGMMDDVRVYDFELSDSQVTTLYESFVISPISNWQFEGDLTDSVDGNDGDDNKGTVTFDPNGVTDMAAMLDGGAHVTTSNTPFDFEQNEPFTLSTWFKTDVTGVTDVLLGKLTRGSGYQIYLKANNEVVTQVGKDSDERIIVETIGANVRDNDWHHMAMTYDGSGAASGVKVYLDGTEASLDIKDNSLDPTDDISTIKKFTIGNQQENGKFFFTGMMDDVRVYNFELTADQVTDVFIVP